VEADPAPAMRADFMSCLDQSAGNIGIAFQRESGAKDSDGYLALGEEMQQSPDSRSAAVLVDRFDNQITVPWSHAGAGNFPEIGFRLIVAIGDRVFRSFLVVEDNLQGESCAAWPLRVGRMSAVADHISR